MEISCHALCSDYSIYSSYEKYPQAATGFARMPRIRQLCHLRLASVTSNIKCLSRELANSGMISLLID